SRFPCAARRSPPCSERCRRRSTLRSPAPGHPRVSRQPARRGPVSSAPFWSVLLFTEDFSRRDHCIAVDRNGIFDMSGVSTGQCDHHGCVSRLRKTQYKLIPFLQPINGQSQPAELILTIWIGTGKIVDQVWLKF